MEFSFLNSMMRPPQLATLVHQDNNVIACEAKLL